jgi:hypothetical protein
MIQGLDSLNAERRKPRDRRHPRVRPGGRRSDRQAKVEALIQLLMDPTDRKARGQVLTSVAGVTPGRV